MISSIVHGSISHPMLKPGRHYLRHSGDNYSLPNNWTSPAVMAASSPRSRRNCPPAFHGIIHKLLRSCNMKRPRIGRYVSNYNVSDQCHWWPPCLPDAAPCMSPTYLFAIHGKLETWMCVTLGPWVVSRSSQFGGRFRAFHATSTQVPSITWRKPQSA